MFQSFERFINFEKKTDLLKRSYRLDRMDFMLKSFGNPQNQYQTLHVAGSKGKGSTATYLAAALEGLGYVTGLYTSPHLEDYRERVTLGGRFFPDFLYLETVKEVNTFVEEALVQGLFAPWGGDPTTFELLTLTAFLIFARAGVQWAVIEVGLGGRLDATNLILPKACIITPLELEHTDVLGDTLAMIAREKAGILKPNTPYLSAPQPPEAQKMIELRSQELGCPALLPPLQFYSQVQLELDTKGTRIRGQDPQGRNLNFTLQNVGEVMGINALTALALLTQMGFISGPSEVEKVQKALEKVHLRGRMEALKSFVPVYLDGAHTPASVQSVFKTFSTLFSGPRTVLFGAAEGKSTAEMAAILKPHFHNILIVRPGTFKSSNLVDLAQAFGGEGPGLRVIPEAEEALEFALLAGLPTLVVGSFYLAAEVAKAARKMGL